MKKTLVSILIFLTLLPVLASAQIVTFPNRGGTGTTTLPLIDQLLVGFGNGIYGLRRLVAGMNITISTTTKTITINSTASGSHGVSTSSPIATSNVTYYAQNGTLKGVATSTLSETVSGLEFTANPIIIGAARILSLTTGFTIPTTTLLSNLGNFYNLPSSRISAGQLLAWAGNTLYSFALGTTSIDSSAKIKGIVTDETGGGALVFGTGPTLSSTTISGILKLSSLTPSRVLFVDSQSRATTTGTLGNIESSIGGQNILLETEIDGCSELAALLDDETGTCGGFVVSVGPTLSSTTANGRTKLASASTSQMEILGKLFDVTNSAGTKGLVFQSTGTSTHWVSTSSLNISGGGGSGTVGSGNTGQFPMYNATGTTLTATSAITARGGVVTINTQGTRGLKINASGNISQIGLTQVGITSSAIQLSSTGSQLLFQNNVSTANSGIDFKSGTAGGFQTFFTKTGPAESIRITTAGRFGLGTTTPRALLTISATNATTSLFSIASTTDRSLEVAVNGFTGLGTSTPAKRLSVAGAMRLTGGFFDAANQVGTKGLVLKSTGTSTIWVATSTLGLGGSGLTSLNGQTGSTQLFATTTLDGGFGFLSLLNVHTFNIPTAKAANFLGLLKGTDWTSFNGRIASSAIDTSAEIKALVTDETGSGALVFGTAPTISSTTITGILKLSSQTASRVLGTDAQSRATTTFVSSNLLNALTDETGTGVAVFGTAPTLSSTTITGILKLTNQTASRGLFTDSQSRATTTALSATLLNSLTDETGTGVVVFSTAPTISSSTLSGRTSLRSASTSAEQFLGPVRDVTNSAGIKGQLFSSTGTSTLWIASTTLGNVQSGLAGQTSFYKNSGTILSPTSTIFITPNNRVGIGTTTPSSKLYVTNPDATNLVPEIIENVTTASSSTAGPMFLRNFLPSSQMIDGFGTSLSFRVKDADLTTSTLGDFRFSRSGSDNTGLFTLNVARLGTLFNVITASSSALGIGTTTPVQRLSVTGNTLIRGSAGTSTAAAVLSVVSNRGNSSVTDVSVINRGIRNDNIGPSYMTFHDSLSPAVNDLVSTFDAYGRDSAANTQEYGRFDALIQDTTNGSEDSVWAVGNVIAGSLKRSDYLGDGISIDGDGTSNPIPANGSLLIGDGSDSGTVEIEDSPSCFGVGGCTPMTQKGSVLVEDGLSVGTTTAFSTTIGQTTGAVIQGVDNSSALVVAIPATLANITTADTFIDFRGNNGQAGSIAGTAVSGTIAYNTFTGSHYTHVEDMSNVKIGYLLEATGQSTEEYSHLSNSRLACTRASKTVYGAYGGTTNDGFETVLSLGTGKMWVTNTGEELHTGDMLMSSNVCGMAERQKHIPEGFFDHFLTSIFGEHDEDTVSNITAAKLMTNIHWNIGETSRFVPVIYLGG